MHSAAVELQAVERGYAYEERERGVEPAREADDDVAATQEPQPRDEARDLLREDFGRSARKRLDAALLRRLAEIRAVLCKAVYARASRVEQI